MFAGYLLGLRWFAYVDVIFLASRHTFWMLFGIVSHLLPILAVLRILTWAKGRWSNHPLAKDIQTLYNQTVENGQQYDWTHAATRINLEYQKYVIFYFIFFSFICFLFVYFFTEKNFVKL